MTGTFAFSMDIDLPDLPDAACKGIDRPEVFFPPAGGGWAPAFEQAKAICAGCPAAVACLEFALTHDVNGIWGGTSVPERKQLLQERAS